MGMQKTIFDLIDNEQEPTENDDYLGPKSSGYSYQTYIQSHAWKKKREVAFLVLGEKCQRCSKTDVPLHVHHKHYKTLYHERIEDVTVLCVPCHELTHRKIKVEREERWCDNAFYTWVEKVYGEDAHEYMDMELLGEEFDDWIESKEDEFY